MDPGLATRIFWATGQLILHPSYASIIVHFVLSHRVDFVLLATMRCASPTVRDHLYASECAYNV